jgi:hypothetical protein
MEFSIETASFYSRIDNNAKPIQIVQKSIKDVKAKSNPYKEFVTSLKTI